MENIVFNLEWVDEGCFKAPKSKALSNLKKAENLYRYDKEHEEECV